MSKTAKILGGLLILMTIATVVKLKYQKASINKSEHNEKSSEKLIKEDKGAVYRAKFAGAYTTEMKGKKSSNTDVEMYALNENGGAKWLWIKNDGKNGAVIDDEKTGTWDANENSMTIRIKGNSGIIDETYELKEGTFINSQLPNRYLKLTE